MIDEILLSEFEKFPKTRKEAQAINSKSYFTGIPCKRGHIDLRFTINTMCYECNRELKKKRYKEDPTPFKEQNKKGSKKYAEKIKKGKDKWKKNNLDKVRKSKKKWTTNHSEKNKEIQKEYREKRKTNKINLKHDRARSQIVRICHGKKAKKAWYKLFDFSENDFRSHIQKQFRDGMTWQNYAIYWQIDHIKPICKCITYEEAWNLNNLQPLLVKENLYKSYLYNEI